MVRTTIAIHSSFFSVQVLHSFAACPVPSLPILTYTFFFLFTTKVSVRFSAAIMSKYLIVAILLAYVEARFGQEQIPVAAVSALTSFGQPGDAGSLSGAVPGVLLAAANPCEKVRRVVPSHNMCSC